MRCITAARQCLELVLASDARCCRLHRHMPAVLRVPVGLHWCACCPAGHDEGSASQKAVSQRNAHLHLCRCPGLWANSELCWMLVECSSALREPELTRLPACRPSPTQVSCGLSSRNPSALASTGLPPGSASSMVSLLAARRPLSTAVWALIAAACCGMLLQLVLCRCAGDGHWSYRRHGESACTALPGSPYSKDARLTPCVVCLAAVEHHHGRLAAPLSS